MPRPDIEDASVTCVYCGSTDAEPEQDGEFGYYSCLDCGGDFLYRRLAPDGPVCAAGLPIAPAAEQPDSAPVFLGATITRRQE
jgi:hypothetical protein